MTSNVTLQRVQCLSALVAATTLLAACGGGSSATPPPPPPPAATLSLTGTAATGAAIASATVTAKCNGGTGAATTAANGTYSIALTAGTLPCVIKVATTAGDLYSVATGTGTTATANITPFTQLIVANLTGKDPAAYFTDFGAADITAMTSAVVTTAQVAVVTVLKNNGIDTSALPTSLVAGSLVAASGSTAGNAYDVALDALKAKLTSSATTLAQLTNMVLQTATSTAPSATPSVALDVALQPGAATCAALRSGTYRVIEPQIENPRNSGSSSTGKVIVNATASATTFVVTDPARTSPTTFTVVSGAPCRFANAAGDEGVVSQAGVIAYRNVSPATAGVAFPEQSIALAELAGDWNFVSYDRGNLTDPLGPRATSGTVSSGGVLTTTNYCADAKTCVATGLPTVPLTVNVAGGFNVNFSTNEYSRMFAFRAGGGEIMLVGASADGTFAFGTRRRTNGLPVVGASSAGWNVGTNNVLVGTAYGPRGLAITESSNTVTSVDTVNGSFTRDNIINVVSRVTRPETIFANAVAGNARQGYRWRQPATGVLNSAGATTNVSEFVDLPLRGMGLFAQVFPTANLAASSFNLTVTRPAP